MSNNYYVRVPHPSCSGRCPEHCWDAVHLGQTAAGWKFAFRAYGPDRWDCPDSVTWNVNDYDSWNRLLALGPIYDDSNRRVEPDELRNRIANAAISDKPRMGADFCDGNLNAFYLEEFR